MNIKQFKYALSLILFGVAMIGLSSCDGTEGPETSYEYFVSADLLEEYTEAELDLNLDEAGLDAFMPLTNSDIAVYKIIYKTTDLDGNTVNASGAAIIPTSPGLFNVMSYQHGTIRNKEDAPSKFKAFTEVSTVGVAFASIGYVMSIPDYLGYGETENMNHPYEHGKSLAKASHDMLKAVYEFIEIKQLNTEKLFLAGYSEGGFATMALHKYIEEESDLVVTKSAPGSGAYSTTNFAAYIAGVNADMNFLGYYLWVLDAYNDIYDLTNSWSYYLNAPYDEYIEEGGYFDDRLSANPMILFTEEFRNDLINGENEALKAALANNDYNNWKPTAPVQLWHGTADDFVPYFLSEDAYENMTALGADVELIPVVGGGHDVGTPAAYFAGIYSYFR